eukprot:CAMPEP_0172470678 /NCGR_PEP_ID=MMETSP1065-20121228/66976_1 /TAXON_ID=265537 /ORGANISM="Amphiprora paludosa, Strain CCMP125" /LENGTH=43 /DNA_ID= /DNA_START= /DNA_END= /DNA_ORIENTATION=
MSIIVVRRDTLSDVAKSIPPASMVYLNEVDRRLYHVLWREHHR